MSIALNSECFMCHLRRHLATARALGSEEKATAFAKELMKLYINTPADVGSPYLGPATSDLFHEMYGLELDRFRQEKADSNAFVLERMPRIRQRVEQAADPVYAGLQYAILGNYIDFSALQGEVSFETLDRMLDEGEQLEVDKAVYGEFLADLQGEKKLLYLTDNAGEIGFDRILAEELQKRFPDLSITFCVRGAPAMNDATREDAEAVGLPFPVIDNGNRIAGTQLDMLGREAREAMDAADVILAKGMGNAETMYGCDYPVYYAFLAKCKRFMDEFHVAKFTPMFVR